MIRDSDMFRRQLLLLAASLSRQGELVEAAAVNNVLRSIDFRKSQEALAEHRLPELSGLLPALKREYDAIILLFRTGAYLAHRGLSFADVAGMSSCDRLLPNTRDQLLPSASPNTRTGPVSWTRWRGHTSPIVTDDQKAKSWRENASKHLLDLNYSCDIDPAEVSRLHLDFGKELRRRMGTPTPPARLCTDKQPARKLRIG